MSERIGDCVEHGWLDASVPGRITGEIWLRGRKEPLRLDLEGYPMADLAGVLLSFKHPAVPKQTYTGNALHTEQKGVAGDITASRRTLQGKPPYGRDALKTVNALYIK